MSQTALQATPRPVLADALPGGILRDLTLVMASAITVGVIGNAAVPLPFTPVPLTLATLAVLLSGAALGPWRAGLGMVVYMLAGVAGMPWFAGQNSGWSFPTFGYIVGYVVAAIVVGHLARRGADRRMAAAAGAMVLGNVVIYTAGVAWLVPSLGVGLGEALRLGVWPFLIGDTVKLALATGLLPAAWAGLRRIDHDAAS